MKGYREIERRLESLKRSTNLTIGLKNETWEFEGLNSPYISHQSVTLKEGHGVDNLITFNNGVLFMHYSQTTLEGDLISREIPAFHIWPLFRFPATAPIWVNGIVVISYPDTFSGYTENGTAKFDYPAKVWAKKTNGEIVWFTETPFSRFLQDEETKKVLIGCKELLLNTKKRQFCINNILHEFDEEVCYPYNIVENNMGKIIEALTPYGVKVTCTGECKGQDCVDCPKRGFYTITEDE